MKNPSEVKQRQNALTDLYLDNPSLAYITHSSEVIGANLHDPFRTSVTVSDDMQVPFKVGIHRAVGGDHHFPNPSDMLCAALASCFESTVCLIANRLDIQLTETRVSASARVDVRGILMIDKSVPVGYQSMSLVVVLVSHAPNQKLMKILLGAAEQSCIV
jgi:organic hydroperoxide reductase OsmC/OhrA